MLEHLEQQKRLTGNQWRIIATANLGDMLDFFDFFLIGYVLAFIIGSWQLTFGQSAMILLASGLGAVPGAFFWGWMADKIGRRKVFMATALNVAIATGIMAMTPDQDALDSRLAVPGVLPLLRRLRQRRPDRGRHSAGTGIRPGVQARLGERADHRAAAGGQPAGCGVGRVPRTGDRLARPVPGRPRTGGAGADDPLLGARIAALAAAHGPHGGGAQVARLGAAGRSAADRAADQHSRRGEGSAVACSCSAIRAAWRRPVSPRSARPAASGCCCGSPRCSCWCCGSRRPRPRT